MPEQPKPPAQDQKKSIFSSKEESSPNIISDVASQVNNVSRGLKTLEDRFDTMRKKNQVTEQNMISNDRKLFSDLKLMNSEILEIKSELSEIKEKLTLFVKELKLSATKEEVKVIQKYISYWEPLNFVTRQELEKMGLEQKPLKR